MSRHRIYPHFKRLADLTIASVGIIALSPVMALTAAAVGRDLGKPVIFKQDRLGKDGKIFTLYKFRSMRDVNESEGLTDDEQRLTAFGKLLRSTSLDELPSLWNVIRGDMSLVGPRPLLVEYLDLYTPEQARRHQVRPGVTGLAQVNGRNNVRWEDRFRLDVEYADSYTLLGDLKILVRTLASVVKREGIAHEGHATMPLYGPTTSEPKKGGALA